VVAQRPLGLDAGRADEYEAVDRVGKVGSARHIEGNSPPVGVAEEGCRALNLVPHVRVQKFSVFGNAPWLRRRWRGPVTGKVNRVRLVRIRQGLGEGAHVLTTASPSVQEKERGSLVGTQNLDVQVVVRHRKAIWAKEESTGQSAGNHLYAAAFHPMIVAPIFWPRARFVPALEAVMAPSWMPSPA